MRYLPRGLRDRIPGQLPAGAEIVAGTRTNGNQIVVFGCLLSSGHNAPVSGDDVTVQPDRPPGGSRRLHLLAFLVHRVHGEEAKDEQVHGGRENGQAEEDEDEAEGDILVLLGEHVVLL